MNIFLNIGLATLAVSVTACGTAETSKENAAATAPPETTAQTHSGAGTVDSVSGQQVTISHGPIKSLEWPAMTMAFTVKDASSVQGIKAGDRVEFTFSKSGNESALTSITKQ
ncbi:MAG TPA: copper-binding protein [Sphingomicrobium sp.]|nr:copper-binding protein [Sphingomicrobium sp.]